MIVCGSCYRRNKKTVFMIVASWRYKILRTGVDGWAYILDQVIIIPEDAGEDISSVNVKCARCRNDFLIPKTFIKEEKVQVKDVCVTPVCAQCKNTSDFFIVGEVPYIIQQRGNLILMRKIIGEKRQNITDKKAAELVARLLQEEDYSIPIICRECNSDEINLIPVKNDDSMSQLKFDSAVLGKHNSY